MTDLASGNPPQYTKTAFKQQLVATMAAKYLLFCAVKNHQFCPMLSMLQADVELPGKKQFQVLLKQRYDQIVANCFKDLGATAKIFLAIDCLTSFNHLSVMAITV